MYSLSQYGVNTIFFCPAHKGALQLFFAFQFFSIAPTFLSLLFLPLSLYDFSFRFFLLFLLFLLLVAVVRPISVSTVYTLSTWSRIARRKARDDPPCLVAGYADDFRDRFDTRQFAALRLSGIHKLFVMSCVVGNVTLLWVPGINFGWHCGGCRALD